MHPELPRKVQDVVARRALVPARSKSLSRRSSEVSAATTAVPLDLVFSALSSPTRRAIVDKLSRGKSSVTELAAPFKMSLPAVSKHLSVLEKAQVITKVKEGRTFICRIEPGSLQLAARWINSYGALWDRQLDSLSEYLEKEG